MIEKTVDRDKILKVLHEEFEAGRGVWLTVTGSSMEPLLRHLRDKVILVPPEKYVPETGDIVLFIRKGGACVLHRIIGRTPNGGYIVNGDAQTWVENIGSDQILAIAAALVRKGHYIQTGNKIYRLYVFCWGLTRPARGIIFRSTGRIKRCVNKVRTLKKGKNTDD